jgi:hypothetical protein
MNPNPQAKVGQAIDELQALTALRDSRGWQIILRRFNEDFAGLTVKLHDLNTPAAEAEILRQARGRIERDFSPVKLLENLIAKNSAAAERGLSASPRAA